MSDYEFDPEESVSAGFSQEESEDHFSQSRSEAQKSKPHRLPASDDEEDDSYGSQSDEASDSSEDAGVSTDNFEVVANKS